MTAVLIFLIVFTAYLYISPKPVKEENWLSEFLNIRTFTRVSAYDWQETYTCTKDGTCGIAVCVRVTTCNSAFSCTYTCPTKAHATVSQSGCTKSGCVCTENCGGTAMCSDRVCSYTCESGWFSDDGDTYDGCENAAPTYIVNSSANNTNPAINNPVLFYSQWNDLTGDTAALGANVSMFIFSWNISATLDCASGTWVDDTASNFLTGNWTNTTKTINAGCAGKVISYRFYANDTKNRQNVSSTATITVQAADTTPLTYSNVGQNVSNTSTIALGDSVNLSAQWSDNVALSMWWLYNGTTNTSYNTFTTGNWSNVTWNTTGLTKGTTYTLRIYANDTSNNQNVTGVWQYTIDSTPPTYNSNSTNSTLAGTPVKHSLNWTDNVGLSGYIFQFCNGTWNGTSCLKNSPTTLTYAGCTMSDSVYECKNSGESCISFETCVKRSACLVDACDIGACTALDHTTSNSSGCTLSPASGYDCGCQNEGCAGADGCSGWSTGSCTISGSCTYTCDTGYYNCDGIDTNGCEASTICSNWDNTTWVSFSGTIWSNVTKTVNSTIGATISWCVYANDTSNNWNVSDIYSYVTTGPHLEVNLITPSPSICTVSHPCNWIKNSAYSIQARVECSDGSCGNVNGTVRYNASSSNPDTLLNATIQSCGSMNENDICLLNWTVNVTGDIGVFWKVDVNVSSSFSNILSNDTSDAIIKIATSPNLQIGGIALYYYTGERVNGNVTVIPLENPNNKTISVVTNGEWFVDFEIGNGNIQHYTVIIDENQKIGYNEIKTGTSADSELNCSTQSISLSGYSIDVNSGASINSGDVKISVLDTDYTNTTTFSGSWSASIHPCLIPGKVYTLRILITDKTGKRGELLQKYPAK